MEPLARSTIGGYPLGALLGEGGAGAVHATWGPDGEPLAIKVVADAGDAERVRLDREAAALVRLDHPNVLRLVELGHDGAYSYLVMPRIEGVTLRALIERGPLAPESAARIVLEAARGVGAIHRAGLCHRDLKPDNLMLADDGRVVVIDLGLALAADWTRQTTEGSIAGSLPYMAPEQIEGAADARSDVWSLGVTWWELVTGKRPFARTRPLEEVAAIAAGARRPITELDRRIDEPLAALLEACLAPEPADRPASAEVLADALARLVPPDPEALRRLRADRDDWEREIAGRMATRCAERASELAAAGEPFAALRAIDRGLAYCPGDPELEQLLARLIPEPGAEPVALEPAPPARALARRRWRAPVAVGLAVATIALGGGLVLGGDDAPAPRTAPVVAGSPRAVVETIIDAARSGDPAPLRSLCVDASTAAARELCDALPGMPAWLRRVEPFRDAIVEGEYRTKEGAHVHVRRGSRRRTIDLVRVDGRHYLGHP